MHMHGWGAVLTEKSGGRQKQVQCSDMDPLPGHLGKTLSLTYSRTLSKSFDLAKPQFLFSKLMSACIFEIGKKLLSYFLE